MNVVAYCRVSTADQSTDLQVTELTAYAARMNWTLTEVYQDQISGSKDRRPGLDRLMEDARMRRFDAVLVWKLDRFGRSLSQLIDNVQKLDGYGVRFLSSTENIDTNHGSPIGKLMLHLFASFAEFERGLIRERVNAGVREAQRRGKHCGRPVRVFRRDEALRLKSEGMSLRQIAKLLNVPVMTISDAVRKACLQVGGSSAGNTAVAVG